MRFKHTIQGGAVGLLMVAGCGLDALPSLQGDIETAQEPAHAGLQPDEHPPGAETVEVETQPFRSFVPFENHKHSVFTERALNMLPENLRQTLGEASEASDIPFSDKKTKSRFHFDNCRIEESFETMRDYYNRAVEALSPDGYDPEVAIIAFGVVLHQIQDFYSHSNWVEANGSALFEIGGMAPPAARAGDRLGDMVVLRSDGPFQSGVTRASTGPDARIPWVFVGSNTVRGLNHGHLRRQRGCPCLPTPTRRYRTAIWCSIKTSIWP